MRFNQLIYFIFLCILLAHCKSPSNHVKDNFNKIDNSLEKSNAGLLNSAEHVYNNIKLKRNQNEALALKADTIYLVANAVSKFIDSLKQILQQKDTSGVNLDVGAKLLINTKTGNDLTKKLLDVYAYINSYSVDNSNRQKLDSSLQSIKKIQNDKDWTKNFFDTTPTVAIVTILTKFKTDCMNAETIALTDINERLK